MLPNLELEYHVQFRNSKSLFPLTKMIKIYRHTHMMPASFHHTQLRLTHNYMVVREL